MPAILLFISSFISFGLSSSNLLKFGIRENASEENILAVRSPKILHITTHGYFISDENITNPMLKSGVALSGANIGIKQQTGEGLVMHLIYLD